MPAQTAEIGDGELRRRNDVPHDRPRNIPDRLAALQQTLEKVVLLAADQFSVHTSQRGVEAPVTDQPRTPESHISATGHPSCRKRPHVGTEVHRIGDRHLDPPGHPRRTSLGILGDDAPPGDHGTGMRIEEVGIGAQEIGVHPLVVVDEGHKRGRRLTQAPVAGIGDPRAGFADHTQPHAGMCGPKRGETLSRIVRRIVVYDDTLPLFRRKRLPHNRFERRKQRHGTVVGGDHERDANHCTKIAISSQKMLYLRKFQIKPKSYDHAQTDSRLSADARNRVVRLHGIGAERHMEKFRRAARRRHLPDRIRSLDPDALPHVRHGTLRRRTERHDDRHHARRGHDSRRRR